MGRTNNRKAYRAKLVAFLSFLDFDQDVEPPQRPQTYPKDQQFSQERLLQITPKDVERWLGMLAYGKEEPQESDEPKGARVNTIEYAKKAISSFMPHQAHPYNEVTQFGNPTRHPDIQKFIAQMKLHEVRGQGRDSQARRPFTEGETTSVLKALREAPEYGNVTRYGLPAIVCFQIHLLGRYDCATQLQTTKLRAHERYPNFALHTRLAWSKNVRQEGDAPWQIVLGQMNPEFCVLMSLGIWLEYYLSQTEGLSPYVFDFSGNYTIPKGGEVSNDHVVKQLGKVFKAESFIPERTADAGPIGCYSLRKYATTRARNNGTVSKDDSDYRGRWKAGRRVSDRYYFELPYVDAKVASALCHGGPCSYRIKANSPVTDDWILTYVVPKISASPKYGKAIAKVLGKAVLSVIFSTKSAWVPQEIVIRVKAAYKELLDHQGGGNIDYEVCPIEKRQLIITGADSHLQIRETANTQERQGQQEQGPEQPNQQGGAAGHLDAQTTHQLIELLLANQNQILAGIHDLQNERDADRAAISTQLQRMQRNIRDYTNQPFRNLLGAARNRGQQQPRRNEDNPLAPPNPLAAPRAELSPRPADVYVLWDEYNVGLHGRKPACQFSPQERGRVKYKYCRRKVVWDTISLLINSGLTREVACNRLYEVYGHGSTVTAIIDKLKRDKKNNTVDARLLPAA